MLNGNNQTAAPPPTGLAGTARQNGHDHGEATARTEKLARATAALSWSVNALARSTDLEDVLERIFQEIVAAAGATVGFLFGYDAAANTLATRFWIDETGSGRGGCPHGPAVLRGPFDADVTPAFRTYTARREVMVVTFDALPERLRAEAWPGMVEWHKAHGRACAAAVPILSGGAGLGIIGLAWPTPGAFSPAQSELLLALAGQAGVALKLERLADEARETAVTRERETAAEAQVREFAKANQALRRALETLSSDAGADAVISHILRASCDLVGAVSASLWLYDVGADSAHVRSTLDGNGLHRGAEPENPFRGKTIPLRAALPALAALVGERRPQWIAVDPAVGLVREAHGYLQRIGVRWLAVVPMLVGSDLIGGLNLRFGEEVEPEALEKPMEIVQALAHQAALAIHMDRLAAKLREAAVTAERNKLAREVHDTLAQGYATIAFRATLSDDAGPEELRRRLDAVGRLAREYLVEARRTFSSWASRSDETLWTALECLVDAHRRGGEHRVVLLGDALPIRGLVARELARIAQEAVTNALRHASPKRVLVELALADDGTIELSVEDDGCGFVAPARTGFGITSMRERASAIGARLAIETAPDRGTRVLVRLRHEETAP